MSLRPNAPVFWTEVEAQIPAAPLSPLPRPEAEKSSCHRPFPPAPGQDPTLRTVHTKDQLNYSPVCLNMQKWVKMRNQLGKSWVLPSHFSLKEPNIEAKLFSLHAAGCKHLGFYSASPEPTMEKQHSVLILHWTSRKLENCSNIDWYILFIFA